MYILYIVCAYVMQSGIKQVSVCVLESSQTLRAMFAMNFWGVKLMFSLDALIVPDVYI